MTQIGTATTTKRPQLSSDQNHTLVETAKIIEGGNNMSIILKLLSNIIETRINKSYSLLELTSKLPEVTNVSYANMITEKFMGIPQNLDLQKKGYCKGYS
jgi:dynactin complex subunit